MAEPSPSEYMTAFWQQFSDEAEQLIVKHSTRISKAAATHAFTRTVEGVQQLALENLPQTPQEHSVTIIENIDLAWIEALGATWQIDPSFFVEYLADRTRSHIPWLEVFGTSPANQKRPWSYECHPWSYPKSHESEKPSDSHWHVDGIVEYGWGPGKTMDLQSDYCLVPRRLEHDAMSSWHGITRISCFRKSHTAYLILIDAPQVKPREGHSTRESRSQLHLPVANNRGGLIVPEMFDHDHFSLRQCLRQFLSHSWHFNVLFPGRGSPPPSPEVLWHLLVASTWKANLQVLDAQIKHISLKELRRPDIEINDRLHARREDLVRLRAAVTTARTWMPAAVRRETEAIAQQQQQQQQQQHQHQHQQYQHQHQHQPQQQYHYAGAELNHVGHADEIFDETLAEAAALEKFLMDSFHLLLSSIGVLEAKASIEQARRAQRLTQLAFLYIPLSFVTGVFGMNLREINGAAPPVWVFFCVLAGTAVCTAAGFVAFSWWQKVVDRKEKLA